MLLMLIDCLTKEENYEVYFSLVYRQRSVFAIKKFKLKCEDNNYACVTFKRSKKLLVAFEEPDIGTWQCLHLAVKLPSTFSGTSKWQKTTGTDLLAAMFQRIASHMP